MPSSFADVLAWLGRHTDYERMAKPPTAPGAWDLSRVRALCAAVGDPQRRYVTLHVAGTKGKGSVATMAAALASAPGRRVGLYTSPHLVSLRERIVVDGAALPEAAWVAAADAVCPAAEALAAAGRPVTFFEVTTAMAFVAFAAAGVHVAVIEVGLGGRLDATNVIAPAGCAITALGLEHTAILGSTIPAIAREKVGIVKAGVPVVVATQPPDAHAVIAAAAAAVGAPVRWVGQDVRVAVAGTGADRRVRVTTPHATYDDLPLPVLGAPQADNLAVAVALVEALPAAGLPLDADQGRAALARLRLPARLDLVPAGHGRPALLLDGAHTAASVATFAETLAAHCPGRPRVVVFGAMGDKDVAALAAPLAGVADHAIATQTDSPRAMPATAVAEALRHAGVRAVECEPDAARALERAAAIASAAGTVAVTGSLHLAGRAYEVFASATGYGADRLPVLGPGPEHRPAAGDPIAVCDYDPAWPARFEAEAARLRAACAGRLQRIEHVGSTAVPGCAAKPILDVMAGVASLADADACVPALVGRGYEYRPDLERAMPERRYFALGPPGERAVHVHMVEIGGPFWVRHLAFRDWLRTHPDDVGAYTALKRDLARRFRDDRVGYTDAKTAFIVAIEAQAGRRAKGPGAPPAARVQ